jgi:hypothetical protein
MNSRTRSSATNPSGGTRSRKCPHTVSRSSAHTARKRRYIIATNLCIAKITQRAPHRRVSREAQVSAEANLYHRHRPSGFSEPPPKRRNERLRPAQGIRPFHRRYKGKPAVSLIVALPIFFPRRDTLIPWSLHIPGVRSLSTRNVSQRRSK